MSGTYQIHFDRSIRSLDDAVRKLRTLCGHFAKQGGATIKVGALGLPSGRELRPVLLVGPLDPSQKGQSIGLASVVTPDKSLRPGTRLVREWRGKTHTVVVTEDGFEYAGKTFPSLTKIAHAVTGAHWSGPRFFGLIGKPASNGQLRSDAAGSVAAAEAAND